MAALFQNKNYRRLFSAVAVGNLGDGVSMLAFPWLATLITRDPFLIALVGFSGKLPWFLLSIPAGVITDRRDRKSLMLQADLFRMVVTGIVVALILNIGSFPPENGSLYIAALSVLAFLLGSAEVLRDNAAQTILPSVVSPKELEQANGQLWSVEQIMGQFVGPPLAGILIAWAVPAPFILDAITFLLAAWMVWLLRLPKRAPVPKRSVIVEVKEGARWIWAHRTIFQLAVMLGFVNLFSIMGFTILILFSQEILDLSAAGHGILMTAGAAGGVIGGLVGPRIVARIGQQRSLYLAMFVFPLPFVVLAITSSPLVAGAALFFEMMGALVWNIVTVSYRQRVIPDELLGRVNSIYRFFGWGLMPVGALLGGWIVLVAEPELGREFGLRLVFWLSAAGMGAMFIYGLLRLRIES